MMRNVTFDGERFDALRIEAANRYRNIFESAGIKPSNHLLSFISAQWDAAPMAMKETVVLKSRSGCSAAAASVTSQPDTGAQACTAGGDPPVKLRMVEGYVDGIDGRRVSGWAYDKMQPDLALDVEIHHNGQRIAVARADRLRADLARAGKGDGRHAFVAVLEAPISPDERNRLNVFARCGDAGDLVPLVRTGQQQQPAALNAKMPTPATRLTHSTPC
jgi:hypothetical protein